MLKHEILADILRTKASRMMPGTRLPSIRALIQRYGYSLPTVATALRRLENEGVLETRRGSGIFVVGQPGARCIEYHRAHFPAKSLDMKELSCTRAMAAVGWKVVVRRHELDFDDRMLTASTTAAAHVVTPDLLSEKFDLFTPLMEQGIPVVACGREAGPFKLDFVTSDDSQIVLRLVQHLSSLGHRQLAMLVNEPEFFEVQQRCQRFSETAQLFDLPCPVIVPCGTAVGASSMIAAHIGLSRYLAANPNPPFTALVTTSSSGIIGALRAFHEARIKVPQRCSLASYGMELDNELFVPSITDAGTKEECWGEGVVQVLQKRFSDPDAPPIGFRLPIDLHIRESTCPPEPGMGAV